MNMQMLALAFLGFTAVGGLAWVFVYPLLSGEKKAESRRASIARPEPAARQSVDKSQRSRREQVEGSLKELEARRAKEKKVSLPTRLDAGRPRDLDAAEILDRVRRLRRGLLRGGVRGRWRPAGRPRHGVRRRLRPAALDAGLPQDPPREGCF